MLIIRRVHRSTTHALVSLRFALYSLAFRELAARDTIAEGCLAGQLAAADVDA